MSKSPSLRRIQADIRELKMDPSDRYHASPMENDMFEWHFTIRGADGTDFEGGIYHGRILLPPEYPYKPPHIVFLTPSGRFETNTKVCLSFSAFHPELWQPAWGIRLILEALISFLPTPADGAIGALDWSASERKKLAIKSQSFQCHCCGPVMALLPKLKPAAATSPSNEQGGEGATASKPSRFQKEIEQLQLLQQQQHGRNDNDNDGEDKGENTKEEPKGAASEGGVAADQDSSNKEEAGATTEASYSADVGDTAEADEPTSMPSVEDVAATRADPLAPNQAPSPELVPLPATERPAQPTPPPSRRRAGDTSDDNAASSDVGTIPTEAAVEGETAEQAATEATDDAAQGLDDDDDKSTTWWWWDPLMQVAVVLLSFICYLLTKKVQLAWDELQRLQASLGEENN